MSPFARSMQARPWLSPGLPPWHMWGTTEQFSFVPPGFPPPQTVQLARINYKRPETWSFVFAGRLTGGSTNTSGSDYHVVMLFDLIYGVGRSSDNTQQPQVGNPLDRHAFAKLVWTVPNGQTPGQINGSVKYTTVVRSPLLDDTDSESFERIEWLAAQDINVQVNISTDAEFQTIRGEASAYFAPRSHIRPDWLRGDVPPELQFPGEEVEGR